MLMFTYNYVINLTINAFCVHFKFVVVCNESKNRIEMYTYPGNHGVGGYLTSNLLLS